MRVLNYFNRRWQNRTEVKFLQAYLNLEGATLSVDGDYGKKTVNAVEEYQKRNGLLVDGSAGQQTLRKMGFLSCDNKNIVMLEIPFHKLSAVNVLVKNGQAYNCEKFAREGKFDIVINGAFFQMATRKIVQLAVVKGKVINWGMGLRGIAFPNDWSGAKYATADDVIGKPFDLEGGAPFLVSDYKIDKQGLADFKNPAIMTSKTRRNCLGITQTSIVLMFSIAPVSLYNMATEAINQHIKYVIGCDGGGSQSIYMGGAWVITTDGRQIPAAIGMRWKK